jgi:benzodiazapine receptor
MATTVPSSDETAVTIPDESSRRLVDPRWRSVAIFSAALIGTATVTAVGAALVYSARDVWFDNLRRPAWGPPSWGFVAGSVVFYLAVGLAGWRIGVRAPGSPALTLWVVQLGLSLGWTVLFFGLWVPTWALVEAAVLLVMAVLTILAAWPSTRLGAWLLVPYVAWIGFLMAFDAAIVALN